MSFGVTPQGFNLKRLYDIVSDINTRLSAIKDATTGESLTPNLENVNDPLIQVVQSLSDGLSVCWENLALAYNQYDPLKAVSEGLSGLVQLNGIRRIPASKSTATVTLTFSSYTTVPAGSQVALASDSTVTFSTTAAVTGGAGAHSISVLSDTYGPVAAPAGTLTKIVTPISGWASVTNATDASIGRVEETDDELRQRQQISTDATSRSLVDDIYANIIGLSGVSLCRIYVNSTLTTDGRSIPAKSIACLVSGGVDADIAQILFQQTPLGIGYYGNVTVNKNDVMGNTYPISFLRPTATNIYVAITVLVVNSNIWPADGSTQIKNAIMKYVAGGAGALGITSGFERDGFLPGEGVYSGELYTPVNSVPGIRVTALYVGTAASPSGSSVAITWDHIAVFDTSRITVTVN